MTNAALNDLSAFWMPFTANRAFKAAPRLMEEAKGMYYRSHDGREILDATAGLWCVNAGHGRAEIAEAARGQLATLDFAPTFQMGHSIGFETARRLAALAPEGLDHVFFTNSGSESVDTALKIAIAYHRARGDSGRFRLIGRERGYHGTNLGGTSVGGIAANRGGFFSMLPGVDHLSHTHIPANVFSRGQPEYGVELADDLEALVALHGAGSIAAVIVEPVAGSTGVLIPPLGYLERLREICTRHGILLIFDEVITGFGRLGAPFAAHRFGVTPDLMTCAKGLTNGAIPMGVVIASHAVHDAIIEGAPEGAIELFHGYTYSAHPVACAVANAVFDIYEQEGLLTRALDLEELWTEALHDLRDLPGVTDIRTFGLVGAVELDPQSGPPGRRAFEAFTKAYDEGVLLRVTGNTIAMSPPLIVEEAQIGRIAETLRAVIRG
jgi:beta-alanine--pyruvate transaminase